MSASTALVTAEELIRLPRGPFRYELINGELKSMSPSGHPHGRITARLTGPLAQFVWDNGLGEVFGAETGFKLTSDPDTVLAPDIAYVAKQNLYKARETEGYWPGPPDLAVEVLSPSDRPAEGRAKILQWLGSGTKQVWIVSPKDCTVTVYRSPSDSTTFSGQDYLEAGDILPGFRISLERIFGTGSAGVSPAPLGL